MSRKFDIISIFLMVVLMIILFFVIFGYFNGSSILTSTDGSDIQNTNIIGSGEDNSSIISNNYKNNEESPIIPIINPDSTREPVNDIVESGETENSGELSQGGDGVTGTKNSNTVPSSTSNPLILSSDSNISSREKKEILNELDQTLMELLEVVDSVKTVDETRLITDESGVQQ